MNKTQPKEEQAWRWRLCSIPLLRSGVASASMKSDELQDAKRSHGTISFDEDGAERPGKAQSVQEKANKNSAGPGAMSLPTRSQRLRKNDSSSPIPQQAGGKQGDSSNVFVQQQPSRLAQVAFCTFPCRCCSGSACAARTQRACGSFLPRSFLVSRGMVPRSLFPKALEG